MDTPVIARWLAHAVEAAGTSHLERGTPCQDAALAAAGPRAAVAVLCDGAGSAPLSHEGARAVSTALRAWLPVHHRRLCALPLPDARAAITLEAQRALLERAAALGVEVRALACTLAFASVDGDSALVGNLGDGVVGGLSGGESTTLLGPMRGEFANETVFVTSRHAAEHLQLAQLPAATVDGFALMSDGAAFSLVDARTGHLARALHHLAAWCATLQPSDVADALSTSLVPLLRSRTRDDVSVALLCHVRLDLDTLLTRPRRLQQAVLGVGSALGLRNRLRVLAARLAQPEASARRVGIEVGLSTRAARGHLDALASLIVPVGDRASDVGGQQPTVRASA